MALLEHRYDPFEALPTELTEKILERLPFMDVLTCRRVNQSWNVICNAYLPVYGQSIGYVDADIGDLQEFERLLMNRELGFLNGLHLNPVNFVYTDEDTDNCLINLCNYGLKYISLKAPFSEYGSKGLELVLRIVYGNRFSIQKLILVGHTCIAFPNIYDLLRGLPSNGVYPLLREIVFSHMLFPYGWGWTSSLTSVVPNLKILRGRVLLLPSDRYCTTTLECINQFMIPHNMVDQGYNFKEVLRVTRALSKLTELYFHCTHVIPMMPIQERPDMFDLVHRNAVNLKKVMICVHHLLTFRDKYCNDRFINLTDVGYCEYSCTNLSRRDKLLFKALFCNKFLFPNLKFVTVSMSTFARAYRPMYLPRTTHSVNQHLITLEVRDFRDDRYNTASLGMILCRVSHLRVRIQDFGNRPLFLSSSIFTDCVSMEKLSIRISNIVHGEANCEHDLDALLCGLSVDEVILLKEQSAAGQLDLRRLSIAPIRPSLLMATRLRSLELFDDLQRPAFRRVTLLSCLLMFARLPLLTIVIRTSRQHRTYYNELSEFLTYSIVGSR